MVLESMEDWLKLDAVESFPIVYKCTAQWAVVLMCFFLELVDNTEMVDHWEACFEDSLFSRLVEVSSPQYALQEDVWKHFVNDREQTDWPSCTATSSLHCAMLLELGRVEGHLLKSWVRRLTMASPSSCITPPVMLSSPGALLWSSFFFEASNSAGRMTGGALSMMVYVATVAPLCLFVAF